MGERWQLPVLKIHRNSCNRVRIHCNSWICSAELNTDFSYLTFNFTNLNTSYSLLCIFHTSLLTPYSLLLLLRSLLTLRYRLFHFCIHYIFNSLSYLFFPHLSYLTLHFWLFISNYLLLTSSHSLLFTPHLFQFIFLIFFSDHSWLLCSMTASVYLFLRRDFILMVIRPYSSLLASPHSL